MLLHERHSAGTVVKMKHLVSVGSWFGVEKGSGFSLLLLSEFDCVSLAGSALELGIGALTIRLK